MVKVKFLGGAAGVVGLDEISIEGKQLKVEDILKEVSKIIKKKLTLEEKKGIKSVYILNVDDINLSVIVNYNGENISNINGLKTVLEGGELILTSPVGGG